MVSNRNIPTFGLSRRGFTLIELLVVISVISMISSIVFASLNNARERAKVAAGQKFDRHTYSAFNDDLTASWEFDGDVGTVVLDQSGNKNNLTLTSGTTMPVTPNPFSSGKSLFVQPASTRTAQSGTLTSAPTGDFSVSLWIYPVATGGIQYISNTYGPANGKWHIGNVLGNIKAIYRNSGQTKVLDGPVIRPNKWVHVTLACGGTSTNLYIDGGFVSQTGLASSCIYLNNAPIILQGILLSGTSRNDYYVDNVRIYKKSLTLSQIKGIYMAEKEKFERLAVIQ